MAFRSPKSDPIIAAFLAAALGLGTLLWMYYPTIPRSVLGWLLLIVIGIPTWILLEWLGERVLAAHFFSRVGRATRIALAVPLLILLLIIAAYLIRLGQKAIAGS
jgi:hypothetical protein